MYALTFFVSIMAITSSALAQQYTINTPMNVVVCLPALLSWAGGQAPYFLSVNPAGQPDAAPLVDLGKIDSGTAVTWVANLGVGTSAFLNLRDNTGTLAQSGPFTIQSGTNTTCVDQPPVVTTANGGTVSGGSSNSSNTGGSGSGSSSSSQSTSKTSSTGQSSATSKPNGAISQRAPVAVAAFLTLSFLALSS